MGQISIFQGVMAINDQDHAKRLYLGQNTEGNSAMNKEYQEYLELIRLIERLHRRFIDVLKTDLTGAGIRDINGVQALLMTNIGEEQIVIRDLVERGYYLGSNVPYNTKKLTGLGCLNQERSTHDRRSVTISLTEKALQVVERMRNLLNDSAETFSQSGAGLQDMENICGQLRSLERIWADYINYGNKKVA